MTTAQIKSIEAAHGTISRALLRYLGNKWFLIAAGCLALVLAIAFSWSWLVAAGLATILLSVLPCLVMCGLGLCMHKFLGDSKSSQVSEPTVADPPDSSIQMAANRSATQAPSYCGGSVVNTANAAETVDTESKETIHA